MNGPTASLSVVTLFLNADPVVKGVLALLLAASVWSWAVIIDKLWRLGAASRTARGHEARVPPHSRLRNCSRPRARRCQRPGRSDAFGRMGREHCRAQPDGETAVERRDRIERAMRLALNAELRRLELRLPFLATLGSAAPFIGLFGTVWGIMRSFEGIAAAHNTSLAVVAPGIAEALFATAMGLAAAIPAVVAYNKITVDLGRFAGRMQGLIGRAAGLLSRPALRA